MPKKKLPDSLKRMAVTRLSETDFALDQPNPLPQSVVDRFPELRGWQEGEKERVRKTEASIREVVTALREFREIQSLSDLIDGTKPGDTLVWNGTEWVAQGQKVTP